MALVLARLAKVPAWAWVILALLAWGGWQRHAAISARDNLASYKQEVQAEFDKAKAKDAAETSRRLKTLQEVADAATIQSNANRVDADGARAALDRLRKQLAAGGHAGGGGAGAAASGASTNAAAVVPAELLVKCGERVVGLSEYADAARTAGQACERAYDSLTKRGPNP